MSDKLVIAVFRRRPGDNEYALTTLAETANHLGLQSTILAMQDLHDEGSVDPAYHAKARVLNRALQEIGMGRYQVQIRALPRLGHRDYFDFSGGYLPSQVSDIFRVSERRVNSS